MTSLLHSLGSHNFSGTGAFALSDLKRYSPEEIRVTIQALMAEDRNDLALALGEAGVSLHPASEDMLAVTGLLAMTQQDWGCAIERLTELKAIQGERVQAFTHLMLTRAHRCDLDPAAALDAVVQGLAQFPLDADLQQQFNELTDGKQQPFSAVHADLSSNN